MEREHSLQSRNVALEDLRDVLREELQPRHEGDTLIPRHLYALIEMAIEGEERASIKDKLRRCSCEPLFMEPHYRELRHYGPLLVSGMNRDDDVLLDIWGQSHGDIIYAWIVSELSDHAMAEHLRPARFIRDKDTPYLLRFYDPLVTPVLHKVADKKWVEWLFAPMVSWWYPVATPQEETWSRIEGGGASRSSRGIQLMLTEELSEALKNDPFPYRLLNTVEQMLPSVFESDCFGARLAKIEDLLEAGRKRNLSKEDDLTDYVLRLLEKPELERSHFWQEAVRKAAAGSSSLAGLLRRMETLI
ncbi:MAG: DUF4123 domain-containing protein [Zoogloeaceae bacterium]|nr:DUF4123 domain-containing protein [Zoogloeaceae bacterium]